MTRWLQRRLGVASGATAGADEDGRAIVEFVFLGILLLLPLVYLVLTVARIQAAAFSASLAGREAGRAFVTSPTESDAEARARAAAALAFADFAFDRGTSLALECDGSPCLRPEGTVTSTARIEVALPLIPDFLADRLPSTVSISSTHVATVDRFVAR
ncbi:pilus assembly protein TadE [Intrasporangium oryzae NRRL B-24470]|uniref:Pilus assembly protein TadE n=1 Tax=Intrasporangium oryzae NRRL B-24470 TaxID=1386089 RepID=W9G4K3_9MICO|nr:pilus assembly protein [Intrasporangium oryzae]EWT00237.1 pilus assembly protein TadE [Intrasporangium oryzae NRRL B-24470]